MMTWQQKVAGDTTLFDGPEYQMIQSTLKQLNDMDDEEMKKRTSHLMMEVDRLQEASRHSTTGCFEWIDGLLVRALEEGKFLHLIRHTLFCHSSHVHHDE